MVKVEKVIQGHSIAIIWQIYTTIKEEQYSTEYLFELFDTLYAIPLRLLKQYSVVCAGCDLQF